MNRKLLMLAGMLACSILAGCSKDEQASAPSGQPSPAQTEMGQGGGGQKASLPSGDKKKPLEAYADLKSNLQTALLFYALTGKPVDHDKLVPYYDDGYDKEVDTFKKRERAEAAKGRIAADIEKAKDARYVKLEFALDVRPYDFDKKGFQQEDLLNTPYYALALSEYRSPADTSPIRPMLGNYQHAISNFKDFAFIKVDDEPAARRIEELRSAKAGLKMILYVYAQAAPASDYLREEDWMAPTPSGSGKRVDAVEFMLAKGRLEQSVMSQAILYQIIDKDGAVIYSRSL